MGRTSGVRWRFTTGDGSSGVRVWGCWWLLTTIGHRGDRGRRVRSVAQSQAAGGRRAGLKGRGACREEERVITRRGSPRGEG
jgi:hypothetical protein